MILTVDNSKYLFEKDFKRYVATRDYHNAFLFCLANLQSDTYRTIAKNSAHTLIDSHSYLLFEKYKRVYRFVINRKLDEKWLIDTLINQGINDMVRSSMSIGYIRIFNRINCFSFSNLFTECNIGMLNDNNTSVIYYDFSFFRTDHSVAKAICKGIIKLYM